MKNKCCEEVSNMNRSNIVTSSNKEFQFLRGKMDMQALFQKLVQCRIKGKYGE